MLVLFIYKNILPVFYYKYIFWYFHNVLVLFGGSIFSHKWDHNRYCHLGSGWTLKKQELRGDWTLLKTSNLSIRRLAVGLSLSSDPGTVYMGSHFCEIYREFFNYCGIFFSHLQISLIVGNVSNIKLFSRRFV